MEVLGLLDVLESNILDGIKLPFTKKMLIDEEKVLSIIDKMRLVVQGGGSLAKDAISGRPIKKEEIPESFDETEDLNLKNKDDVKAVEILQQAYQMAKEIRDGADKYADEVLANLEATSTRILRTIKAGRDRLSTKTQDQPAMEHAKNEA